LRRTLDFEFFTERVRKLIAGEVEGEMSDVILMVKLKFTPPSWKIWKAKLIEWFSLKRYTGTIKGSGEKVQYKIVYIKTAKTWNVIISD
jgi:hypothetical protein